MRIIAPPEALRAARALLGVSQRDVADQAGVPQRSLSIVENSDYLLADTNLLLVDFYTAKGLVFLGEGFIGSEIARCGACWAAPENPGKPESTEPQFQTLDVSVSFKAARAFLNRERADIADSAGLTVAAVRGLEAGKKWTESYQKLVEFYESEGIEFTGWGEPSTQKFYGVGVRWKGERRVSTRS
ncbi:helix-turn-helix domain-containing protein [Rhizobium indigoferae]|uniref:Helix-turn-helix transcriptional regulator n=1 Tax=Rhizobium indigoferae TaxID=158891 RepID=A0ABZ0ZE47_9HYPH|nr:helix-turn-helix transcriptional regulator [Rhizobium indigoferae]NNU56123.1 helix-turn-helix transcriptional regulator [Rhizobium indigoferae]WQN37756.1 helix-turn-helix transcriptional regulator [Rhizobium indigoferae]GLR59355.1 hypothetical protein GCM10007919_40820 [Rhizobium indigoferae]